MQLPPFPMWQYQPGMLGPWGSQPSLSGRPAYLPSGSSQASEDPVIDPFVDEEERDSLMGHMSSSENDSDNEEPPPPKKARYSVSTETNRAWKKVVEKALKNDKRKALTSKFPCPSSDWVHTPKLDDSITCIIPKSAKTYDR